MPSTFREFVDKKTRQAKRQLNTLYKVLEKEGMSVSNFLEEDDPYIFLAAPGRQLSFDGVRLYKIGNDIAFRVQKESDTHPYGKAYSLDVEGMFDDYLSDEMDEEKAGKEVIKSVIEELRGFFNKSIEAEKELRDAESDSMNDPLGRVVLRSTGTDYSNQVMNSNPSRNY